MVELLGPISQAAGALFIGFVGLWLAHNYRRQVRLKLAEHLFVSYRKLWEHTRIVSERGKVPDPENRRQLAEKMEAWYYENGHGLLVPPATRKLFIAVRLLLTASPAQAEPASLRDSLLAAKPDMVEPMLACACIRFTSVLRTQLKQDLAIYSPKTNRQRNPYRDDERALLKACGISAGRPPSRRRPPSGPCICGTCDIESPEQWRQ